MIKVLGPKDKSPRPDKYRDYMDYRGVAEEKEVQQLSQGAVSLGRYLHPNKRQGQELFLSADILKRHCAVIGKTGAGKTEGVIVPWAIGLMKNGHSVVTVDVVGNLTNRLSNEAKRLGCRVWYWDHGDPTSSDSWNWLDAIQLSDDRSIESAITSILGHPIPNDPHKFFYDRDVCWLRALIPIVKMVYSYNAKPRHLLRLIAFQDELRNVFRQYPQVRNYDIDLADFLQFSVDEHSKAVRGLLNALSVFKISSVMQVTERSDFALSDIDSRPTLLVIRHEMGNPKSSQLTSLILDQLFGHVYNRNAGKASKKIPLNFIIDEAPQLKEHIKYEQVLAVARNANVGICLAAQDVTQFGDERKTAEILSNCNTLIATKGVSPQVAEYLSKQMGKRREQQVRINQQRTLADDFRDIDSGKSFFGVVLDSMFSSGTGVDTVEVPVLGDREIMHPPVGLYPAVVLASPVTSKPFMVELDTAGRKI
jgi:type IV secretory pathway TraG/TraD family ATPase VirD4